ncbi:cholinephosphotransferase 1 isoform X1 [Aethina tumida]|uniref:cholinephosphotransferase 1 isoform X1 n=1 Tax=Aethina tumida TaxID=116153 RepID=UPI00096B0A01|nr:cholinephosphotransferase 1 isoform X1 [Aethina tumida]
MRFYKTRLLTDGQLQRLKDHKYSCQSNSFMDKLMQPYWNWLVKQVPERLAPNLITVVGLIINIVTALILVWYSPDAKEEVPRWACALAAFGLFAYQSLDAIDGKQARRTGAQNSLGELFDHGCDSVSTVFVALSACIAVQLGNYPGWMFFQCFCAMTLFYCAHWQTYVSGTLRFGRVDVTEAQFTIMLILMISAIFGPSVWSTKFFSDSIYMWYSIPLSTFAAGFFSLYSCLEVIFTGGVGKNGSTVAGTSVLSPVIPFSFVLLPAFIIYQKSPQQVYQQHPALYILTFGLVAARVTNRLVVAHMSKSEMEYLDWSLLGPALLFLNQYFNSFIPEYYVLWVAMILVTIDLLRYCGQICLEIADYLRIDIFRLPSPNSNKYPTEKNGRDKKYVHSDEDSEPLLENVEDH